MTEKIIRYDFYTLFQLSPNGLIIFDKKGIISINNTLLDILKIDKQKENEIKVENIIEKSSWAKIKKWMKYNSSVEDALYKDQIVFIDMIGNKIVSQLVIKKLINTDEGVQYIGFLVHPSQTEPQIVNYNLSNDICHLLKRENIIINETVEQKIAQTIKMRTIEKNNKENSFFTKRENEVLRLSIEGLSIKVIADKLAISSRTVEKYRTKLMEKSGSKNIVEAIVFSLRNHLIEI